MRFVLALACAAINGALPMAAMAQQYPTKAIRMVIGFPPGGGTDIVGRIAAQKLSEVLGQQVLPDNRGGRERPDCGRGRGESDTRWVHRDYGAHRGDVDPAVADQAPLRPRKRLRTDFARCDCAKPARRASIAAGEKREGPDRTSQGEA
jgi:hypothetical protein